MRIRLQDRDGGEGQGASASGDERRPLRVFHLPQNVASVMRYNIEGLEELGIENRSLTITASKAAEMGGLTYFDRWHSKRNPKRWYFELRILTSLVRGLLWADVVHWYFDATIYRNGFDLWLAQKLCSRRVVEFLGSDLRDTLKAGEDDPKLLALPVSELGYDIAAGTQRSHDNQHRFADAGFDFFVMPDLVDSVLEQYADRVTVVERPVDPDLLTRPRDKRAPGIGSRPLIVHAPTSPAIKGTPLVLEAIEKLKRTRDIDFVLLEGKPHAEVIELLARADIALDQFILGEYGVFALEAMALGTPAVAWVKPSVRRRHPEDLPVVSSTAEDLYATLDALLDNPKVLDELGERSREFIRRYHTPRAIAALLLDGYGKT